MRARTALRAFAPGGAVLLVACAARAQEQAGAGIAGGALLGAEAVVLTQAAFDVRPAWAYFVGGVAGAAVGGYSGLLVEDGAEPAASVWMLAAGMGLAIPTLIWVGNAREPEAPTDVPAPTPSFGPGEAHSDVRRELVPRRAALAVPLLIGVW
jgi:hypothetical protein